MQSVTTLRGIKDKNKNVKQIEEAKKRREIFTAGITRRETEEGWYQVSDRGKENENGNMRENERTGGREKARVSERDKKT